MAEKITLIYDVRTGSLVKAQSQLNRTRQRTNQLQQSTKGLTGSFKGLQTQLLAMFGTLAILNGIRRTINTIKDFEFTMSKVRAISGATSAEFEKLKKNALAVGGSTRFTATQVAKLQIELAKLGTSAENIVKLTAEIAKLAQVADTDLANAAKITKQVLNAFKLPAEEASRVINTMAESFSKSALDIDKFSVSMANVAPVANAMGFSVEQTTAILGVLVDRGVDASKAGTDLRKIFIELAVEGITLNDALNKIKFSTDKAEEAFDLFGQRAVGSALILADTQDEIEAFTAELEDANKELTTMVEIMEDNLETDLKIMASAFESLTLKGESLNPVIRTFTQLMTGFLIFMRDEGLDILKGLTLQFPGAIRGGEGTATADFLESIRRTKVARSVGLGVTTSAAANKSRLAALAKEEQERNKVIIDALIEELKEIFKERKKLEGGIESRKDAFVEEKKLINEVADLIFGVNASVEDANEKFLDSIAKNLAKQAELHKKHLDNRKEDADAEKRLQMERAQAATDAAAMIEASFQALGAISSKFIVLEKAATLAVIILSLNEQLAKISAKHAANPVVAAVLSGAAVALAASRTAAVLTVKPPEFKEGVIDFQGQGTGTSDSNIVRISRGESVMKATATQQSKELLKRINSEEINDSMFSAMINGNFESKEMVAGLSDVNSSIKKLPIHQTFFNEKGVSNYIKKEHARIKYLHNRMLN